MKRGMLSLAAVFLLSACSVLQKEEDPQMKLAVRSVQKPLPPEKTKELLGKMGGNFVYGQGFGEAAITVGTIFAFPPYAIYVLGNGALSVAGYKPLHVTDALPDDARNGWNDVYDSVTGVPGHVSAAVAGEEFRNREVIEEDYKAFINSAYPAEETAATTL